MKQNNCDNNSYCTHESCDLLLPFFVNGTLSAEEHEAVDRHLALCEACRRSLAELAHLHQLVAGQDSGFRIPQDHLSSLLERLNPAPSSAATSVAPKPRSFSRLLSWLASPVPSSRQRLLPAFIIVAAVGTGVLLLGRQFASPDFRTLSNEVAADKGRIEIIIAPTATQAEVNALFRQHAVQIVSGPSAIGALRLSVPVNSEATQVRDRLAESPYVTYAELLGN
ncbi:MAG: zf-HC2 domain-containing protein [Pseudomonadota bacterium]